jgi:hypothetical protein
MQARMFGMARIVRARRSQEKGRSRLAALVKSAFFA